MRVGRSNSRQFRFFFTIIIHIFILIKFKHLIIHYKIIIKCYSNHYSYLLNLQKGSYLFTSFLFCFKFIASSLLFYFAFFNIFFFLSRGYRSGVATLNKKVARLCEVLGKVYNWQNKIYKFRFTLSSTSYLFLLCFGNIKFYLFLGRLKIAVRLLRMWMSSFYILSWHRG